MHDLDQWEWFCQLMLLAPKRPETADDEALCACARLIEAQAGSSPAVVS